MNKKETAERKLLKALIYKTLKEQMPGLKEIVAICPEAGIPAKEVKPIIIELFVEALNDLFENE